MCFTPDMLSTRLTLCWMDNERKRRVYTLLGVSPVCWCFCSGSEWWRRQRGLASVSDETCRGQDSGRKSERDAVGEMEGQTDGEGQEMKGDKRDWWSHQTLTEKCFPNIKGHDGDSGRLTWDAERNVTELELKEEQLESEGGDPVLPLTFQQSFNINTMELGFLESGWIYKRERSENICFLLEKCQKSRTWNGSSSNWTVIGQQ